MADDIVLNIREKGSRNAARGVGQVDRAVTRLGSSSRKTAGHASLLSRATSGLTKPLRHLEHEALGAAKGIAAAGLAFGSYEGIKRSIETTDQLVKTTVKLHQQFGLTTRSASGLAAVLQARDIDPTALNMGLTTLSKQLVAAEHGTKKAQGGLRLLGIHARDVHKAVGSRDGLESVFERVVARMTEMHGSARKAALGQQLLGRASRGLAPLLQEGALGLSQQLKWAREYGVTLDGHTIKSVEEMVAAQTQAQYAMLGLQIQLGKFAAPLVTKANIALADIVRSFRDGRPEGAKFARTVYQLGTDLKPVGRDLERVGGYLKDHPRLLRAAALGYVAYRLKLLKLISIAPKAYAEGLLAGRAYSLGFGRAATTGPAMARYTGIGGVIGRAIGVAAVGVIAVELEQWLARKVAHGFDELTKGLHASDFDKTVRRGRALMHDPTTRAAVNDWQRRHPALTKRIHSGKMPSPGELASAGYPALIPGAPGVPKGYRPVVAGSPRRRGVHVHVTSSPVIIDGRKAGKAIHRVAVDDRARG
jgi:hypothetical protein